MKTSNGKVRRRKRKIKKKVRIALRWILLITILFAVVTGAVFLIKKLIAPKKVTEEPKIEEMLLTPNEYSRPEIALEQVKGIVIHYTANPGTSAVNNRNYFEGLKDSGLTQASSHFIIGTEGEIIQCIPLDEIAYASNDRNFDTISIEGCHPGEDGKFTEATYNSMIHLVSWLLGKYNLKPEDVIRHYDITGKICPKYFVDHEDEWIKFKEDIDSYIKQYGKK